MLKPFGDEIWISDGPPVEVAGFDYPTRMAIIRLSDGNLFIWSPIALSDDLRTKVDALGKVRHLVAPNSLHHLFLDDWRCAYDDAKLYAPPGLREKRRDLRFDADLAVGPASEWADEIDQVAMFGNLITTEVVFFHRKSRVALFTDLIQHFHPGWFSGWRAIVARLDLMAAAEPSVPRKFRIATINRRAARRSLEHILSWPVEKVLMAHGEPINSDGRTFLRRAFRWLVGS
ncbi:DUF4336 domain-containing protein [Methylocystis parvus]|uniref:DUF4336 domain-containing protein n=1 Tax=Methylocystis parvus TaxID=134 RepID=A0A6B8M319_9HYPH|nr:DUF4336 domain-containing protein [Methylocystis parvus]QGM96735.1 DUF4336 domain-containing protein [Methylocystis parvus]WBJ99395.1 DUF4336 domain-containing protein [Methylocystis parvus OBBP]